MPLHAGDHENSAFEVPKIDVLDSTSGVEPGEPEQEMTEGEYRYQRFVKEEEIPATSLAERIRSASRRSY